MRRRPFLAIVTTLVLIAVVRRFGSSALKTAHTQRVVANGDKKTAKLGVNAKFITELVTLLRICVPSLVSPEAGIALAIAALMVSRTAADLFMIEVQTAIEAAIIARDGNVFGEKLAEFIGAFLPVALINNGMKYLVKELHLRMRGRLTKHLLEKYLSGAVFAQMVHIDSRITNVDQLIVQDVERFTTAVADLFTNVSKPTLDIALYCYRLGTTVGWSGPALMAGYLTLSGGLLTWLRGPSAQLTAVEQRLEGEYRHVHSRLIASAEEVAFLQGASTEKAGILRAFFALQSHIRRSQQFRYLVGTVDTMLAKYAATVVGFYVVSRPFLAPSTAGLQLRSDKSLVQQYYSSGRQLLNLAVAIGRLVLAGRDMTRLAGFTQRITLLTRVLDDLRSGHYVRTMVVSPPSEAAGAASSPAEEFSVLATSGAQGNVAVGCSDTVAALRKNPERRQLMAPSARLIESPDANAIRFVNVPLFTPNGDMLLRSVDLEIQSGMNTLIAGPNGCGKSSLFRVLRGLWPQFGGTISRPPLSQLYYIPQKPYLTIGSLRDQVTYPDSCTGGSELSNERDAAVLAVLRDAHLEPILTRVGGLDAVFDWTEVLSGGEKQRVGFARLLYHRPKFAILDECSSAISVDVEGQLYERCRALGITLFSVSHRKSLWRHHEYLLRYDGQGGYEYRPLTQQDISTAWGS